MGRLAYSKEDIYEMMTSSDELMVFLMEKMLQTLPSVGKHATLSRIVRGQLELSGTFGRGFSGDFGKGRLVEFLSGKMLF